MRIHTLIASIAVALAALMAPVAAFAVTDCGGKGERACCKLERSSACNKGLEEDVAPPCVKARSLEACTCAGVSGVSIGICREKSSSPSFPVPSLPAPAKATPCGGAGQRACCLGEAHPPLGCGPGTHVVNKCDGDCVCGGPDGNKVLLGTKSITHCEKLSCGAKGENPCPLDVQISQKRKSCDAGLAEDFLKNLCVEDSEAVREAMCRATVAMVKSGKAPPPLQLFADEVKRKTRALNKDVNKAGAFLEANKAAAPEIARLWTDVKKARSEFDALFSPDVLCVKSALLARLNALEQRFKPQIDAVARTVKPYGQYPGHFFMSYGLTASLGAGPGLQTGYVVATDYKGDTGVYAFIGPQVLFNASLGDSFGIQFYPATTLAGFEGWGGGFGVSGGPFEVVSGGMDFSFTDIGQPIGLGPNVGVGLGLAPVDVSVSATYTVKLWSTR